jgi:cell division protein FtsL
MGETAVDDFKPNRSVDGMSGGPLPPRAPDAQSDVNSYENDNLTDLGPANNQPAPSFESHPNNLPISGNGGSGSGKKFKVLTVLFAVLFLATGAFAAYQYTQIQQLNKDAETANAEITKLKAENYSLTYDGKDNSNKVILLTKQNESLSTVAKQLKNACGTKCNDISITVNP